MRPTLPLLALAGAADLACLGTLQPRWAALRTVPQRLSASPDQALADIAATALFGVAAWAALALALVLVGATPGRCGGVARRALRFVLPALARRMVASSVGVGLLVTPVAAAAATPAGSARSLPAPAWPVTPDGAGD